MHRRLWVALPLLMVSFAACDRVRQDQSTFLSQEDADWVLTGGKLFP